MDSIELGRLKRIVDETIEDYKDNNDGLNEVLEDE